MRLLHAGVHHGLRRPAAAQSEAHRDRDPRGLGQQHLPVHGLREDHRGRAACVPPACHRRGGEPMNEIARVHNIGGYVPMVDGPEKVSGRAKYTADLIQSQMLAGRIYRSPYAHAEIIEVDTAEAAKVAGVLALVTGADCAKAFGVPPIASTE